MDGPNVEELRDQLERLMREHIDSMAKQTFLGISPEDLRQAAVVLATVLVAAANTDKPLPRKILPTQPAVTDPFQYPDPSKK